MDKVIIELTKKVSSLEPHVELTKNSLKHVDNKISHMSSSLGHARETGKNFMSGKRE
jgi:chaperonin cofactor prefoldin